MTLLEQVGLQEMQTALQQEHAIHLFRLHETFTAPDEKDLSLNTKKSQDHITLSPST